jgi:hypothetical protein
MKIAIMQPYIFPYIGYFQLINSVDKFVFYDDVNFIKGGWINRNRICVNKIEFMYTIPLKAPSPNVLIKDIYLSEVVYYKWLSKFYRTLVDSYKKSNNFLVVFELVKNVLEVDLTKNYSISDLAINSIIKVSEYLELDTTFYRSSMLTNKSKGLERSDRIIQITNELSSNTYINAEGGKHLYDKEYFKSNGIDLIFLKAHALQYPQFSNLFIPFLSIIDILMHNDKSDIIESLNKYELI